MEREAGILKFNYVGIFVGIFCSSVRMPGGLGCWITLTVRMVKPKAADNQEGGEGVQKGLNIGMFYGDKLETKRGNKTAKQKLFKDKLRIDPKITKGGESQLVTKKSIFTDNPVSQAIIKDTFSSLQSNSKSSAGREKIRNRNLEMRKGDGSGRTDQRKLGENIYSKVYVRNFSRARRKNFVEFELNNDSYKISKVRINLVKHKLSKAQLLSLKLKNLPKNECLKNRRHKEICQKKTGIPVHLIPYGVSSIIDHIIPGKISRISDSIRYIKPSCSVDNYGLGNKQDIEFDDSDCPRKAVPSWAQGKTLDQSLAEQEETETDLIFSVCDPPNLDLMFPQAAARRDIWRTPPSSYSSRWGQEGNRGEEVLEEQGLQGEDLVRYVTGRLKE